MGAARRDTHRAVVMHRFGAGFVPTASALSQSSDRIPAFKRRSIPVVCGIAEARLTNFYTGSPIDLNNLCYGANAVGL
jgi:hypothetical protein